MNRDLPPHLQFRWRIQKMASELHATIAKFNALDSNHNALAKQVNELRIQKGP